MSDINILVVVDTHHLETAYLNPSKDPANPTTIAHDDLYMICAATHLVDKQATADLIVKATEGDTVSFRGMSISANSDDAVIAYRIQHWDPPGKTSDYVFDNFQTSAVTVPGAVRHVPSAGALAVTHSPSTFVSLASKVSHVGTEYFYLHIAVFRLDSHREKQTLYGCYSWDPGIVVQ
ncbi:inclusion body family protein [Trinickia sp.]|uniref:inclusion body family protein n=1 Tax=Trinickia sp. TaxID=2571163 RepID=UPI003F811C16